jgi:hypothetical protein
LTAAEKPHPLQKLPELPLPLLPPPELPLPLPLLLLLLLLQPGLLMA